MKTRFIQKYRTILPVILMAFLFTGCMNPQCRISVANARDTEISSVTLKDNADNIYQFNDIEINGIGSYKKLQASIGTNVTLEITNKGGTPSTNTVNLKRVIPETFDGRVLFQIEKKGKAGAFIMPRPEKSGSTDLPWSTPETWQGTPAIPGMSGQ